jgi:hypothetical protein
LGNRKIHFEARHEPHRRSGVLEATTASPIFICSSVAFRSTRMIPLPQRWFKIVVRKDPSHLVVGTSIERVRFARGVRRYASKSYMGKECVMPPGWECVGKFGGFVGRKELSVSACGTVIVTRQAMVKIKRTLRRFMRSKGLRRGAKSSVRLYKEAHKQWLRVMLWAIGVAIPPLAMILAKPAKRSAENCSPRPSGEDLGFGAEPRC